MNHDDQPLPTSKNRRRSLFDNENEEEQNSTFKGFPHEVSDIIYPEEYVEKVSSEIEQWKMHIEKTLAEKQKCKNEKTEIKNSVFNENILTSDQLDFFNSVKLDDYMQKVKDFCNRATIFMNTVDYQPDTEAERWYGAAQKMIEKEIIEKFPKD